MSAPPAGDQNLALTVSMEEIQKQLVQDYPNPEKHPFPVRLPAHPEDSDGEQDLYHNPQFKYPHTLSFLNNFTPEAEEQMIRDFDVARPGATRNIRAPMPLAQSFSNAPDAGGQAQVTGWGGFIKDLTVMGLGWAAEQLGFKAAGGKAEDKSKATPRPASNPRRATQHIDTKKYLPKKASRIPRPAPRLVEQAPPARPAAEPAQKRRRVSVDRTQHIRNGGGPQSFVPASLFDNMDAGSDTEPDDDGEDLAQEYLKKMAANREKDKDRPVETAYGAGVIVLRSFGGTLHVDVPADEAKGRVSEHFTLNIEELTLEDKKKLDLLKEELENNEHIVINEDGSVHYPTLPLVAGLSSPPPSPKLPPAPQMPRGPPTQTPAGYDPTYRPRTPNDTMFHHGSAAVNPLGAHARPVLPTVSRVKTDATPEPPHKVVSGSFGTFEQEEASRFDEREYRLLPGASGEKRKREDQPQAKGADVFKGKPWLKRG